MRRLTKVSNIIRSQKPFHQSAASAIFSVYHWRLTHSTTFIFPRSAAVVYIYPATSKHIREPCTRSRGE